MSGPRQMEKSEVAEPAPAGENGEGEGAARLESQAAAAIAELEPASALDNLEAPEPIVASPTAEASSPTPTPTPTPSQVTVERGAPASTLADLVTEAFRDVAIGAAAYSVELTVMPTGGKRALQHIQLRCKGHPVLVAGTIEQSERLAELRDFDHVAILHEVRLRSPLDITSEEWEQFLRKAEVMLNGAGIQSMRTPPPRELLEQRRSKARVSKGAALALIVVVLLAGLVLWRVAVVVSTG